MSTGQVNETEVKRIKCSWKNIWKTAQNEHIDNFSFAC